MNTSVRTVLLWTSLLLVPVSLRGDYVQSFSEAVRAMDRSQWSDAVAALDAALKDKPDEGGYVIIYGTRRELYVPYFMLGKVYMSLGDCGKALVAFRESEKQGVVQSDPSKFRELRNLKSECPETETQPAETVPPPMPAAAESSTPSTRVKEEPPVTQDTPSPVEVLRKEQEQIQPEQKTEVREGPSSEPKEVEHLVEVRVAKGTLESRLDQARSLLRSNEAWAADDSLIDEHRKLTSLVRRGDAALQGSDLGAINSISRDLLSTTSRIDSLLRLGSAPSRDLVAIFSAYSGGDYSRVITLADRFKSSRPRSRSQAALFKAAALYGLHVRSGAVDTEQLASARRIAEELRALDPKLKPSSRLFPQAFIALFSQ